MKNEFEKNLTDRGWKSMRRLLDREMPEQRRRRPIAWWWFGALLLLPLAGAGGWWLWRQSKPVPAIAPPTETPKVSEPVVEAKNQIESRFDNFLKVVKSGTATEAGANFPKVAAYSSDDSKSSDELTATTASEFPPAQSNGFEPKGESITANPIFRKFETLGEVKALPALLRFVENENKQAINLRPMEAVAPARVKKHASLKRWSFGLNAGLASEQLSSLNGVFGGLTMDWQPARKWGLRSGLQYAQYQLSQKGQPILAVDELDYAEATGNFAVLLDSNNTSGTPTNMDNSSDEVLVPVERIRRLEMPVLAFWQPLRSLRVFGGVSPSFNLSVQASPLGFSNNQQFEADSDFARKNLNELAANTFPRWQMDWQAGLGIRLGRHFELDAFYKHGGPKSGQSAADQFSASGGINGWQPRNAGARHYFILNGILFF